jgi:hypothetical protein
LDSRGRKWWAAGEGYIVGRFINLYSSTNIIRVIKSRRTTRTGHVAHMEETRNTCETFIGKLEGKKLGRPRDR